MGLDTKRISGALVGHRGSKNIAPTFVFRSALVGSDSNSMQVVSKRNQIARVERIETTDQQKRRTQGYRGL